MVYNFVNPSLRAVSTYRDPTFFAEVIAILEVARSPQMDISTYTLYMVQCTVTCTCTYSTLRSLMSTVQ